MRRPFSLLASCMMLAATGSAQESGQTKPDVVRAGASSSCLQQLIRVVNCFASETASLIK